MQTRDTRTQDTRTWKIVVLALLIGIIGGLIGGALVAPLFAQPGPQGPKGDTGAKGDAGTQGVQGIQGIPGIDGTDAILQILQHRNDTAVDTVAYGVSQWFNMSDFDASMNTTINIQQDSKIFVQFSSSFALDAEARIQVRIVVDNQFNSTVAEVASPTPSSIAFTIPGTVEFLTDPLTAGQHTIEVQFQWQLTNAPTILGRTLTVTEITTP